MITPNYLEYQLDLLQTHTQLQESLWRDIIRRMLKTDLSITDTAAWQIEKLQQAGMMYPDIVKMIKTLFQAAGIEVFNYDDTLLAKAGLDPKAIKHLSPAMRNILEAALQKTCTDAINLTKTTAVTSQSLYISACDLAHQQVASGSFSYQQAITNGIKSASQQSLKVIYPSGHRSSLDAAIRRSVLTGVNQTAGQLQSMRANEYGVDLMEITAHDGARPSHAAWQGQLVSLSGRRGYLSLSDIGYGEVTGFMGANCRHNWYMFWEGISSRAYTPRQLKNFQTHKVTYNGKEYLDSDGKKKQRELERDIRSTKQELVMLDEAMKQGVDLKIDFDDASDRLKKQREKLENFCNQTGFRLDPYRTQVHAAASSSGIKNFGRSVSQKAVWASKRQNN